MGWPTREQGVMTTSLTRTEKRLIRYYSNVESDTRTFLIEPMMREQE